ncbi:sigma-70 family RNA polymerase sigma factor [uncultured Draconibacterium sp.]|uniref:RNA polymerase sigma factor n=1 Tax=uncultured Draconibacterium sp. TaxID=1573823 RepID=UPI0029C6F2DA|nr:sigma-70 family RNA polymerase sigma factor [uncultured Draconibacterium sp.]
MTLSNNHNDQSKLWNKVRQGNVIVIEKVYLDYSHLLYQYGLKFTQNTQLIEDCIQDLFLRIIKNSKNFSKAGHPQIYLMRAFRNNLIRLIEREEKFQPGEVDEYQFEILFSAEQEIIHSEEAHINKKLLLQGISKLSSRQKEAIYLRYTKGLEYDEIAEIMKMSIESCRNVIYKAIKSLREGINNSGILLLLFFKKQF